MVKFKIYLLDRPYYFIKKILKLRIIRPTLKITAKIDTSGIYIFNNNNPNQSTDFCEIVSSAVFPPVDLYYLTMI